MIKEEDLKVGLRVRRNEVARNTLYTGQIGTIIHKEYHLYTVRYDMGMENRYSLIDLNTIFDIYSPDDCS